MLKVKPIHFPAPIADAMICALLDDHKTELRLPMKPQPEAFGKAYIYKGAICSWNGLLSFAPYRPGEILYVQETWAKYKELESARTVWLYKADAPQKIIYEEDGMTLSEDQEIGWNPSIHMPKAAARIFLRVTGVRIERLHDMTNATMVEEGISVQDAIHAPWKWHQLWDSPIKPADRALYGWAANPWVWVVRFERVSKELAIREGFCG